METAGWVVLSLSAVPRKLRSVATQMKVSMAFKSVMRSRLPHLISHSYHGPSRTTISQYQNWDVLGCCGVRCNLAAVQMTETICEPAPGASKPRWIFRILLVAGLSPMVVVGRASSLLALLLTALALVAYAILAWR